MRSTKRVILADGPRLLREMLHRVIDKADHLQVVGQLPNDKDLPSYIERHDPEWVIVPLPYSNKTHDWINSYLTDHPSVRMVFLAPDRNHIKMKCQHSYEEDYSDLSLMEFIHILEKDLQHI